MTDDHSLTYIIDAPAYDKNVGGICALHYLAHTLGQLSKRKVYLTTGFTNPRWDGDGINRDAPFFLEGDQSFQSRLYKGLTALKRYVIFATFKRKITRLQARIFPDLLWRYFDKERTVVVYGETVRGNPLKAGHVVRWIMNTPGVCGGDGVYALTDHIFQYHPWFEVDKCYEVKGLLTAIDLEHQLKTYQKLTSDDLQISRNIQNLNKNQCQLEKIYHQVHSIVTTRHRQQLQWQVEIPLQCHKFLKERQHLLTR